MRKGFFTLISTRTLRTIGLILSQSDFFATYKGCTGF
jgi:hypothetical protein